MQSVSKGQVWSVLMLHARVEFVVERLEDDGIEPRAHGTIVASGKPFSFTVRALSKGLRCAKLLRHADGSDAHKPPRYYATPTTLEQTKTASDYRRTKAPKGAQTASPRMEEAYRMRYEQGVSVKDIAKHFGVSDSSVSNWCQHVTEKRIDERRRAELKRTGS